MISDYNFTSYQVIDAFFCFYKQIHECSLGVNFRWQCLILQKKRFFIKKLISILFNQYFVS